MAGHSKWAKIKRAKAANDQKKGKIFTKLARDLTMASKEGGADPDMNFSLRLVIEKAKHANMPADNIKRAIERGVSGGKGEDYTQVSYEAVYSDGIYLIIDCLTDNSNRTVTTIKNILEEHEAKLGEIGSASWQFTELGWFVLGAAKLQKSEKFGEDDLYSGVENDELLDWVLDQNMITDFDQDGGDVDMRVEIYCTKEDYIDLLKKIGEAKWKIWENSLVKKANTEITLDCKKNVEEGLENLIEELENEDDVQDIWHNVNL